MATHIINPDDRAAGVMVSFTHLERNGIKRICKSLKNERINRL